jgi:peptide/nickel transport system substrate-binding protein
VTRGRSTFFLALAALSVHAAASGCRPAAVAKPVELRLGLSNAPSQAPERGVQQLILNLSTEGLLRVNQEGRLESWLAEGWDRSADGLKLTLRLRPDVKFHDGTPADAAAIAAILNARLKTTLRSVAEDVATIAVKGNAAIEVTFKQPTTMFADTLMDVPIVKEGSPIIGTAAFRGTPNGLVAFKQYYDTPAKIDRIAISTHPSIRAAWAELLRGNLDMLYEVGSDAMSTMRDATNVSLYTFDRPFQYLIFLNSRNPKLKDPRIRQALNQAIDRQELIKNGLDGHGTPSGGPVPPQHWAFQQAAETFSYNPAAAQANLKGRMVLRCVTVSEAPFEQLALTVKQQLNEVGIDLQIEPVSVDQLSAALTKPDVEAVLAEASNGWSIFRSYRWWHSRGTSNALKFSNAAVDAALDHIRHSLTDDEYRKAVAEFQHAVAADPPAVFLAWGERSRAISKRFKVEAQPGRDVLATLRQWEATADNTNSQN